MKTFFLLFIAGIETDYDWQRLLLGAFRIIDLFAVSQSHEVNYTTFSIDGKTVKLPELSAPYQVLGLNTKSVPNLLLAEHVVDGDFLNITSYRVKFDLRERSNFATEGNPLVSYNSYQDIVQNLG